MVRETKEEHGKRIKSELSNAWKEDIGAHLLCHRSCDMSVTFVTLPPVARTCALLDCEAVTMCCSQSCLGHRPSSPSDDVVLGHLPVQRHPGPVELLRGLAFIPIGGAEGAQYLVLLILG
jgi:hypothetical protein